MFTACAMIPGRNLWTNKLKFDGKPQALVASYCGTSSENVLRLKKKTQP